MTETEFLGMLVVALSALMAMFSAIITPLVKLNSTITRQNTLLETSVKNDETRDRRLNTHGDVLDKHEKQIAEHEVRLKHLEE